MIDLSTSEVLERSGWLMYKRGAQYFQDGAVTSISAFQAPNQSTHIIAEVDGNRTSAYEVQLSFSERGVYKQGSCSCPAYADGISPCKHMIATMLETIEQYTDQTTVWSKKERKQPEQNTGPTQPSSYQINTASSFVDQLMDQITDEESLAPTAKEPLYIQFELSNVHSDARFGSSVELSMKAGTSRLYVVKDPADFIDAWKQQQSLYFTQNFTYEPSQHIVSEEDAAVLDQLYPLIKSQQWFDENPYYRSPSSAGKMISLPDHFIKEVFPYLEDCDAVTVKERTNEYPFEVVHDTFPEQFHLSKEGEYYMLSILDNGFLGHTVGDSPYFSKHNRLYKLNDSLFQNAVPLFNHLKQHPRNSQFFKREHIEQMAGTLFPILEAFDLLQVDPSIKEKLKRHQCEPVLELQKEDQALQANLFFRYGSESINPFKNTEHEEDQIIPRNMKKERQIMSLIEQANFHWNGEVLSLVDGHDLGRFFYNILPELEDRAEVVKGTGVEDMFNEIPSEIPLTFDVDENYGWFEVRFPTDDLSDEDITNLFKSLQQKQSYHQLENGKVLQLEDDAWSDARTLFERLEIQSNDIQDGVMHLPKYHALQMDEAKGVTQSQAFRELVESIKHPEIANETPPEKLQADLREYQLQGFQWMRALAKHGFGGVLADEMGLGKTLQGLAFILAGRKEKPDAHPYLVVAPSSLIYNWEKEAEKFAPSLNVRVISGSKAQRRAQMEDLEGVDLCITSYPLIRRDTDLYMPYVFQGLLLDEAQSFKNHASQTYKAIRGIRSEQAFALTGTPVENRAEELWSLFSIVMPGLLYDRKSFKGLDQTIIQKKISPFVLRRTKSEVLKELPEKIESTRYTELTKEQRQLYVGYLNEIQAKTKSQLKNQGFQKSRMQILSDLTRLRQLCCHPSLFVENYEGDSGKLEELRAFIREASENGQRMLIFSQFTTMLGLIAKVVEEEGLTYFYLDGNTPSQSRVEMSGHFNEGEKDIFLISLKAGGTGLNLTGADTVVLYDLWWNPAVEQQAADRAHRIGQKKSVQVVKMVAQGTIEEKIQALQEKKQNLFDNLIKSGQTNLNSLSEEDIKEILSL